MYFIVYTIENTSCWFIDDINWLSSLLL